MKKIYLSLTLLMLSLFFIACNKKKTAALPKPTAGQMLKIDSLKIINPDNLYSINDTVCGMDLRESIADTILVDGKLYGFCSPACKKYFLKTSGAFSQ